MKRTLLSLALVGAFLAPAAAQPVPQVGVTFGYIPAQTYSAVWLGLIPAASTTDLICISGSATKSIAIQSIKITGSGTAIAVPATVLRRTSLNTGGTAATTTGNPANTISKRDTTNATATAIPISWTANPTIVDTSPTYIDSGVLAVAATTVGVVSAPLIFDWGKDNVNLQQPPTLRNGQTTQAICVNLNATSATALLTGSITWTEY